MTNQSKFIDKVITV